MAVSLPRMVDAYFTGSNAHAPEVVASAFAADGLVHDEGEVHRGRDAIAGWARATIDKYHMHMVPLSLSEADEAVVVKAAVSGDFPGSPIELSYRFDLADDGIRSLEIGV